MTRESVIKEVIEDLTTELQSDKDFSADKLAVKVKNVYREIVSRRNYGVTSFAKNNDKIAEDLYNNYYHILVNASRYDYNQIGIEGEKSHIENDINRSYVERDKLFADIMPFVSMF